MADENWMCIFCKFDKNNLIHSTWLIRIGKQNNTKNIFNNMTQLLIQSRSYYGLGFITKETIIIHK